jgi:hypothetical protein
MAFGKKLQIDNEHFEPTIQVLIDNGLKVSEHRFGSRRTIYADNEICGVNELDYHLPISENLSQAKFVGFLASFTRTLYNQFRKNPSLYDLKVEWNGISRSKNENTWNKIKSKETFYNVDLTSAYWQIAFKLGYINKTMFEKYLFLDEYKEAKRYCVSFLARTNSMTYFDNREVDFVTCETSALYQVYENVRHELYNCIDEVKKHVKIWIEYNIDGISVSEKYLKKTTTKLDSMGLLYKVNPCVKIDKKTYVAKTKIRNF